MSRSEEGEIILELHRVKKEYKRGPENVIGVEDISLSVKKGDFVIIVGPSGSGKTTLLNLMSGMDRPTQGDVIFERRNLRDLTEESLTEIRREKVGFVFQFFNLVESMTVLENVMTPLLPDENLPDKEIENRALNALSVVGMIEKKDRYPNELSGGEQQRVAIARAIVTDAEIIFADEPTAQLDEENAERIIEILARLNRQKGATIILATASRELANRLRDIATKIVTLQQGKITEIQEKRGNRWVAARR